MEGTEGMSSGVTVKGEEAPDTYRVAARSENPSEFSGPTMGAVSPAAAPAPPPATAPSPAPGSAPAPTTVSAGMPGSEMKKKRGRPRKYGPGGSLTMALSPMPISSSIPLTGEFSAWKRGRGRPVDSFKKHHKSESESAGERVAYSVGANFTPHVINVNAGEDVTMKIISFSQQGSRAICILSANGSISNVTLRQPNSSGGTLTYEGRFEILSLSGSFMPTESGGTKGRSGGMSVSLAGADGRVLGGGLAGLLVAAGPVQVLVGSFLPGHQQEQKPKKQRYEPVQAAMPAAVNSMPVQAAIPVSMNSMPVQAATPATVNSMPREGMPGTNGGPNLNLTSPSSFHGVSWPSMNSSMQGSRNLDIENKLPSSEGETKRSSQ